MVTITKTKPILLFAFLDNVSSFQPCSLDLIRKGMREVWGPVYSARNFALEYKFIHFDDKSKTFSLTTDGERLLRYTGSLRNEFLIHNFKLSFYEPFSSVERELAQRKNMSIQ